METFYYVVVSIEGDYANLKRTDIESDDLKLWMNRGSTYESNVMPRDDISITKHGLKIRLSA